MSEQKPAGRARGRGRPVPANAPGPSRQQPAQGGQLPPPQRSAWEKPLGGDQIRPAAPALIQQGAGRASSHGPPRPVASVPPTGGPSGDTQRGAIRGRRLLYDIIKTRPDTLPTKKGTTGNPVRLSANYFRLNKKPTWCLYQYHVEYAPEVMHRMVRKGLLNVHRETLGSNIFDGSSLFLTNRLPKDVTELYSKNRAEENIQITVKFTGMVSMNEGRCLQILNIIVRKSLEGLKLQLVGRNFFDAAAKIHIRDFNLELWPGYITSIRQHEQDLLLCAEISHKVMRTDTVYEILQKSSEQARGQNYRDVFLKTVIGMIVLTDYNNKFYRIDDVDWTTTASSTFQTKSGAQSFMDYYLKKYNIKIRDPKQPMLISKSKARDIRAGQSEIIALVPELCRATGITDEMRTNFNLMKAMGEYTKVNPDARVKKLLSFNQRLSRTPESINVFKEWQMALDPNLVEFSGRELKNEYIVYKGDKVLTDKFGDWNNSLKSCKLFTVIDLKRWYLVAPQRNMREAEDFLGCLIDAGRGMGFAIAPPRIHELQDDRSSSYVQALEQCSNNDPQLIMCVAPNNRADRYSAIKKKCCVDRAIPTQVMVARTITPKRGASVRTLMSVATKVAIQLNCKLGCAPWMIEMPLSGLMTIGFDVCHDTVNKAKSFGAVVATMDLKTSCKYFSAVTAHENGEELSNHISMNVSKALREYRNIHGTLPSKIVFYRDGVGEGQLHFVVEHEIAALKEKLDQIYKSANVESGYSLGFIVVNKRINSRFFKNGNSNPNPGTVIDDVVTLPESYDFYLVSQSSRQGTVSPTYYNVITENLKLPADKIQILTYKQCHLYYNWPGTTRVPAVCQYAHKLAFLVSQSIHQTPSNLLEKQLYFL